MGILSFFFNDTATTEIYTLSLHDALPICPPDSTAVSSAATATAVLPLPTSPCNRRRIGLSERMLARISDRKSTRLNSSHANISYAVFCLKKKKTNMHDSATVQT